MEAACIYSTSFFQSHLETHLSHSYEEVTWPHSLNPKHVVCHIINIPVHTHSLDILSTTPWSWTDVAGDAHVWMLPQRDPLMNGKGPWDIWKCYKNTLQPCDPKPQHLKSNSTSCNSIFWTYNNTVSSSKFAYL